MFLSEAELEEIFRELRLSEEVVPLIQQLLESFDQQLRSFSTSRESLSQFVYDRFPTPLARRVLRDVAIGSISPIATSSSPRAGELSLDEISAILQREIATAFTNFWQGEQSPIDAYSINNAIVSNEFLTKLFGNLTPPGPLSSDNLPPFGQPEALAQPEGVERDFEALWWELNRSTENAPALQLRTLHVLTNVVNYILIRSSMAPREHLQWLERIPLQFPEGVPTWDRTYQSVLIAVVDGITDLYPDIGEVSYSELVTSILNNPLIPTLGAYLGPFQEEAPPPLSG